MGAAEKMVRKAVVGAFLLCLVVCATGEKSEEKSESAFDACTTKQNELKTTSAQNVLDCGNTKCKFAKGNSAQEQGCLCEKCISEDTAAREASCACGLSDKNSAAACQIYKKLEGTCSGASMNHSGPAVVLIAIMTTVFQWMR